MRLRVADGKIEKVANLTGIRRAQERLANGSD
jgi:hypothetical protein